MTPTRKFGILVGIIGFGVIIYFGGWMLAVGIFIVMWGNNLERSSEQEVL